MQYPGMSRPRSRLMKPSQPPLRWLINVNTWRQTRLMFTKLINARRCRLLIALIMLIVLRPNDRQTHKQLIKRCKNGLERIWKIIKSSKLQPYGFTASFLRNIKINSSSLGGPRRGRRLAKVPRPLSPKLN